MFETTNYQTKKRIDAELFLEDGVTIFGKLSVLPGQRVSDLMNDSRDFLPVEMSDGQTVIVRKSTIARVVQLDQHVDKTKQSDPYEILGVTRDISDDELTKVYHAICAQNHPDKLQAAGMSEAFIQMANSRMIRFNDAYRRIAELRKLQYKAV